MEIHVIYWDLMVIKRTDLNTKTDDSVGLADVFNGMSDPSHG